MRNIQIILVVIDDHTNFNVNLIHFNNLIQFRLIRSKLYGRMGKYFSRRAEIEERLRMFVKTSKYLFEWTNLFQI